MSESQSSSKKSNETKIEKDHTIEGLLSQPADIEKNLNIQSHFQGDVGQLYGQFKDKTATDLIFGQQTPPTEQETQGTPVQADFADTTGTGHLKQDVEQIPTSSSQPTSHIQFTEDSSFKRMEDAIDYITSHPNRLSQEARKKLCNIVQPKEFVQHP